MEWLHEIRLRIRAIFLRRKLDRELDDEIRFHLEMKASRNRSDGMNSRQALVAARREFGNPVRWKESIRYMWTLGFIESVLHDLRFAARSMRKSPGFSITAILVLMLGIGSTTAIFSVVNAVMLRSLPYKNPDRLTLLWGNVMRQKVERRGASYPDYLDWKTQSNSFDGMAAYTDSSFTLNDVNEPELITGESVNAGYFELLGIAPIAGRTFNAGEDVTGKGARVVLISEGLWKRRFGSDQNILGKQLRLNDESFTIIGVMPKWFRGLTDNAEIWAPFASGAAEDYADRGNRGFVAVAKLKPGVTITQAQTELDGISKRLEQTYPDTNAKRGVEVAPLITETVGEFETPLLVLLGAVALVLLIACANVANLLLARSEARRQEIAIRMALGAGRWRVFRQLVTETILLSVIGAGFGVLLSIWSVQLLTKASPITLPSFIKPSVDWTVGGFAIGISIVVGLFVGIAPAFQCGRQDLHETLKESGTRSGDAAGRQMFRSALVVTETALAIMLLIGAGLLMRTFQHLSTMRPGFDPNNTLTMRVVLPDLPQPSQAGSQPSAQSAPDARKIVTGQQILQRIKALPSVTNASVASETPLDGGGGAIFYSAEGQSIVDAQTKPRAFYHRVSPEFFATIGAPIISGRTFTDEEIASRSPVAVVTDNMTRRFWPGQDPIGKRIKSGAPNSTSPWWVIIGVIHEMKYRGLPDNPTADPDIFLPFSDSLRNVAVLIRSSQDPTNLANAARESIHAVDPTMPIYQVSTTSERFGQAIEQQRFAGWMMTVFAGLALTLASIGLYGVMAYTVRRRTRELGVRIAIGASPGSVVSMIIRKGMMMVCLGIAIGLVAAVAMTGLLQSLLFGVSPLDPLTFMGVSVVLAAVAFLACFIPARRASRIDPISALRAE